MAGFMFGFNLTGSIIFLVVVYILSGLKIVNEYERGVKFFLGKYTGIMKPGLRIILPVIMSWYRVDLRVKAVDVPDQDAITRDNVSIKVNAVLYYKVSDASKAILEVEHYNYAVSQLAQTTMRDVVGETSLDELLSKRDSVSKRIREIVDQATDPWGIKVDSVELKHVDKIIVVKANKKNSIKRILKKKKYSKKEIEQIMKSQMPLKQKLKHADFVVDNNKPLTNTKNQIKDIIKKIINN